MYTSLICWCHFDFSRGLQSEFLGFPTSYFCNICSNRCSWGSQSSFSSSIMGDRTSRLEHLLCLKMCLMCLYIYRNSPSYQKAAVSLNRRFASRDAEPPPKRTHDRAVKPSLGQMLRCRRWEDFSRYWQDRTSSSPCFSNVLLARDNQNSRQRLWEVKLEKKDAGKQVCQYFISWLGMIWQSSHLPRIHLQLQRQCMRFAQIKGAAGIARGNRFLRHHSLLKVAWSCIRSSMQHPLCLLYIFQRRLQALHTLLGFLRPKAWKMQPDNGPTLLSSHYTDRSFFCKKILAIIWNSHCQAFSEMSRLQVRIPKCFVCKAHHLFANALPIHRPYHLSKSRHARSQLGANVLRIFTLELQMDLQDILKLGIHVLSSLKKKHFFM